MADFDVERLRKDVESNQSFSKANVMPQPKAAYLAATASSYKADELGQVLLSLLPSLSGNPAIAAELRRRRTELSVISAPSGIFIAWQQSPLAEPRVLMQLNTAATHRLLLALLTLQRDIAPTESES